MRSVFQGAPQPHIDYTHADCNSDPWLSLHVWSTPHKLSHDGDAQACHRTTLPHSAACCVRFQQYLVVQMRQATLAHAGHIGGPGRASVADPAIPFPISLMLASALHLH